MLVKENREKNQKSMNKVHPRLYKMKQKETKQFALFNNIRKKNTLPTYEQSKRGPTLDVYYYHCKLYYDDN